MAISFMEWRTYLYIYERNYMTTKEWKEERESEFDFIIYNFRHAIRHEVEGTNIDNYKDDVRKYLNELKLSHHQDFISLIDHVIGLMPNNKGNGHRELPMEMYQDGWNECLITCLKVLEKIKKELK